MLRHPFLTLNVAFGIGVALIGIGVPLPFAVLIVVAGVTLLGLVLKLSTPGASRPDPATIKHDHFGQPLYPGVSMFLLNGVLQQVPVVRHTIMYDAPASAVKKLQNGQLALVAPGDVEKVSASYNPGYNSKRNGA